MRGCPAVCLSVCLGRCVRHHIVYLYTYCTYLQISRILVRYIVSKRRRSNTQYILTDMVTWIRKADGVTKGCGRMENTVDSNRGLKDARLGM